MAPLSQLLPPLPLPLPTVIFFFCFCFSLSLMRICILQVEAANWCVARSDSTTQALQTALDYACGAGADCTPISSPNGLCYLPNTIQAHASYAFNSYFQRKSMAPGSCDFSATATLSGTDPSYGSCVYPSSLSTAGGTSTNTSAPTTTTPSTTTTTTPLYSGGGNGVNPGMNPPPMITENSKASSRNMDITITLVNFHLILASSLILISTHLALPGVEKRLIQFC